ncbi:MAG: hypothetical protein LBJ64_13285 [Deltaproteobacteria bacterium]|jgi:KDO2-lipid IV(A) lauroyltransferase|nr:hypothetical protein [Deltaproteobacteria bacterium]
MAAIWRKPVLWLILFLTWCLAWLPRPFNLALGDLGGRLFFAAFRRRRVIALDNVSQAQANGYIDPDVPATRIALGSFRNLGRTAAESFCLMHRGLDCFKGRVEFVGADELTALIAQAKSGGAGLVLITAHAGNWELAPAALSGAFNFDISVVGRSQGELSNEILTRLRSRGGGLFIFKDGGARIMLKILRQGGVIGTLFDQADIVGTGGAKLLFMGREALTTLGPFRLAAASGAAVVPLFCRRDGQKHIIEIHPAIKPPANPKDRRWLLSAAQLCNDLLSDFLRRHPEQWMWSHRRWKKPEKPKEEIS